MTVVDTSLIYALLDANDNNHRLAVDWYTSTLPALNTTPLVLAEVDHLAGARLGPRAQSAFRHDLTSGAYDITWWNEATDQCVAIAEQYRDLQVGLTDASLVALATRLGTTEIATFDERHFRAMRPASGGAAFRLLPADA
jgi:predicted nucleic acid-binding protein